MKNKNLTTQRDEDVIAEKLQQALEESARLAIHASLLFAKITQEKDLQTDLSEVGEGCQKPCCLKCRYYSGSI